MNFYNQKLFIGYDSIFFPPTTPNGKKNCFFFFGENTNFIETYNFLNIKPQFFRHVFVPTISKPRSYLTPEYNKVLKDHKLLPIKGVMGDYSRVDKHNFFFDGTRYLNAVDLQYRILRYDTGIGTKFYTEYINSISGINKESYDTTILYAVNLDKPIPTKLQYKKSFVLYNLLLLHSKGKIEKLPFEKIVLFIYNKDGGRYIKLFDTQLANNNLSRVRNFLIKLEQSTDPNTHEDNKIDQDSKITSTESKIVSKSRTGIVSDAIKSFFKSDSLVARTDELQDPNKIVTRSLAYKVSGDPERAKEIAKSIDRKSDEKKKEFVEELSVQILPREKAINTSTDIILKSLDIPKILDFQSPGHILNKRKIDFKENLKADVIDAFGTLATKDIPLKVKKVEIKEIHTGPNEIYKTIKDRYLIDLEDDKGDIHSVHVDFPHLTDNGSFLVNGLQKVLITQLIRFPIFFPKIDTGRFESSYSVMKINSKSLQNGAYLILFMGSYKLPLLMWLGYKYGLKSALEDYGVTYTIN